MEGGARGEFCPSKGIPREKNNFSVIINLKFFNNQITDTDHTCVCIYSNLTKIELGVTPDLVINKVI
jgi:hypothetical protein